MDVSECITKLVTQGAITKAVGDLALDMFKRSKAEYSKTMGPASADAAAALEAAKKLRDKAASRQIKIAAGVRTWRDIERRVVDDPRGGMLAVTNLSSKDTLLGDKRLNALRADNPEHPIFRGGSVDSNAQVVRTDLYNTIGTAMEKFKGKAAANAGKLVDEIFGVDSGNAAAKAVAAGWAKMVDKAVQRAILAGKEFVPNENWRMPQPWNSRRVNKFTEAEFVKDFSGEITSGGVKLWDKETNKYATAARYDDILKQAYHDIADEGGTTAPFSKEMRTFEFQSGQKGADAWKRLQAKYGVGNEIMNMLDQHVDRMASEIALHEIWGPSPQAAFDAAVRLAKAQNPKEALSRGLRYFDSELAARNTFNEASGKGYEVGNETGARIMSGIRQLLGSAALRNLPITIVPSDAAMTFLSAWHDGMSGFNILRHVFDGKMTREEAAHLEIAAHAYSDFIQNKVRRYSDEINYSGLARAVPRAVIRATGADLWTRNLRLGYQMSYFSQIAGHAEQSWNKLPANFRDNFLSQYGFTPAEWDKIRGIAPDVAPNGAKYVNLPELTKADRGLSERLQRAVGERSSYGAHQPDARTRGIAHGGAKAGTIAGETQLSLFQYKQFALERMSTHLMRTLYEGTGSDRFKYGAAFMLMSAAAGAVSLQAANVLAGKNPADMTDWHFWARAFAKGGAGGVYGDMLSEFLNGNYWAGGGIAGGPVGGLAADVLHIPQSAVKLFDEQGRRTSSPISTTFENLKRWTPNTWYTKLAVDRLIWEQLQGLLDPHYRESFERQNKAANKKGGTGYWLGPGAAVQ